MNKYKDWIVRFYASHKDIPKGHSDCETMEELIRCKDCKHFETTFLTEGAGYFYNPCPRMIDRTENDFCSRAERKEE